MKENKSRIFFKRFLFSGFLLLAFLLTSVVKAASPTVSDLITAYRNYVTKQDIVLVAKPPSISDLYTGYKNYIQVPDTQIKTTTPVTPVKTTSTPKTSTITKIVYVQGPAGPKGDQGPQGPAGKDGTASFISSPSSSPNPVAYMPVGITIPNPAANFSGGEYASIANLTSNIFTNNVSNITTLNVSGSSTIGGSLSVTGNVSGMLNPTSMTTAARDALVSPATGLIIYNTTTNALNVYNGTSWGAVGGGGGGSGDALTTNPLSQFASTTSAELAGVISNETGSGALVFATSPTLVTPTLGVATATTINKVTLTTPATGSTITVLDGKTFTSNNTLTLSGTDGSTLNVGTGGTLGTAAYTSSGAYEVPLTFSTGLTRSTNTITVNTSQNISTLSNLTSNGIVTTSGGTGALSITGTTGSGNVVLATSPTLVTPTLGAASASGLTLSSITGSVQCLHVNTSGVISGTGSDCGSGGGGTVPGGSNTQVQYNSAGVFGGITGATTNGTTLTLVAPILGAATATSINGLGITSTTGTLAIANGKTFTSNNTLTLSGTDGSTLNVGTGGTLGTAAYTSSGAYEVPLTFSTGLTRSTNTITVNTSQNISTLSNLTSNGIVTTSGGTGALSITGTTGSGNVVLATSPTLVTPALGTPSALVGTNITGTAAGLTAGNVSTINGLITQGSNVTITGSGTSGSPYNISAAGGSPGGSSGQVQYNNAGSFAGDPTFTFDPANSSLGLSGAGLLAPLTITQTVGATATPGALVTTSTVNSAYVGGQYQVVTNNGTYTGSANPTSLITNYNNVANQSTGGNLVHFFGVVGRAYQQGTGTISEQAGVYADGSATGSGTVTNLMSFFDAGRTVNSGASVTNSYGLRVSGTGGTGTVTNDYGIVINALSKGTSQNVGLVIGGAGAPAPFTGAMYVVAGQSRFDDVIVQNGGANVSVTSTDATLFNQLGTIVGGNASGVLTSFDSTSLGNQGGGQTAAGFTGYRSNLYEANAGTTTNIVNFQAQTGGNSAGGAVTNYYAFKVDDAGASNFTNFYGLYIGNTQHGGNTTTNRYGIYSSDSGATNYFAGPIQAGTVNKVTLTAPASGSTLTILNGKTFTSNNTLTLSGTDGSTLNVGTGGTLGTAAYTSSGAYEVPLTFSTGLTRSTNTITVNTSQNISTLSNLTSNGIVTTSGGTGALSITGTTGSGNVVLATSPTLVTPALGTPSALVGTNITGTAAGLTAGNVTTNANLTGAVTSVGNASSLGSFTSADLSGALTNETGSGAAVFATSPTFVTPTLGAASASGLTLSSITGSNQCLHVNSSGVVSGTGSDCGSGGGGLTIGTTTITSGTDTRVLYDNAGVVGEMTTTGSGTVLALATSPSFTTPAIGAATGTSLALTYAGTAAVTTASGLVLNANSLSTGTGLYAASSSLTSGLLVDLQVSGTAAAASQTALNILTTGATTTNAITTYGAQISNTHSNATSGTNVALYLNSSGATTANYGLLVNAGNSGFGTVAPITLVTIGTGTPTTAANGLNFGTDASANLYRSAAGIIKSDGTIQAGNMQISASTLGITGNNGIIINSNAGTSGAQTTLDNNQSRAPTSGTLQGILISNSSNGFNPTSGTAVYNHIDARGVYKQTSTATGITRDVFINPTVTTAFDFRAFEINGYTNNLLSTTTLANNYTALIGQTTLTNTQAQTVTAASSVYIAGAPIKSTNVTLTNTYGLQIAAGAVSTATNSYGLSVNAQTGATNNYSAAFLGGSVGIGTATPTAPLEVLGTGTGATIAKFTDVNTTGCTLATGGTISCSSDVRLKKNIEDITYGLDTVMALRPVLYNWKYETDGSMKSLGFIAQEVEALVPKLVATDDQGMKSLNTTAIVPILTKAIQEMNLDLDAIAGTAVPLPGSNQESFATAFFNNVQTKISSWMGDVSNGVVDLYAKVIHSDKVKTKELCITDDSGAETCITKAQLDTLISNSSNNNNDNNSNQALVSPTPTPDPVPDPTPAGDPRR